MKRVLSGLLVASLISIGTLASADDWPQYRGPVGDGKSTETLSTQDWPQGATEVWKVPAPLGFSSFSISEGRAFTLISVQEGGKKVENCIALNAKTGEEIWRRPFGESEYGHDGGNAGAPNNRGGDGPRSTPSTDGKHVYVYDSHLLLSCLDASNGNIVWQQDVAKDFEGRNIKWLNATSPLLIGNMVVVGGGGAGQSFLAFRKNNGDVIWKSGDDTITHATPHVTTINKSQQIIFFMQSGLVGVNAETGAELWRSEFPFSVSTAASPISEGDHVYCSAGYGVGAGLFKVTDNPEASEVWFKPNELMNHWSTPVVHDGHIYGIFEFKKYGRAPLQCVEMATGEIKWTERGFGPGNCILVGDKLIVLSDAGELVVADATPEGYNERLRTQAVKGKCWSTPAYSDGKVYVRSTEEAACFALSK